MPTDKKINQVSVLEEKLQNCSIAITTEFRGMDVGDMADLRRKLREAGVEYLVVKNTLAGIAGDNLGKDLRDIIVGSTAIAFGYGEIIDPARALADHIRDAKVDVTIHGALMGEEVLSGSDVQRLAAIPGKPVLMSQMMGSLMSPLNGLVYAMVYHIGGLARVLDARWQQLGGTADEPNPDSVVDEEGDGSVDSSMQEIAIEEADADGAEGSAIEAFEESDGQDVDGETQAGSDVTDVSESETGEGSVAEASVEPNEQDAETAAQVGEEEAE